MHMHMHTHLVADVKICPTLDQLNAHILALPLTSHMPAHTHMHTHTCTHINKIGAVVNIMLASKTKDTNKQTNKSRSTNSGVLSWESLTFLRAPLSRRSLTT